MNRIDERVQHYLDIIAPHVRAREGATLLRELLDQYRLAMREIDALHNAVEYEQKAREVVDCARNLIEYLDQEGERDALSLLEKAVRDFDGIS